MSRRERDTGWFKSTRSTSGGDNCVEVRLVNDTARVRDSKAPDDGMLTFDSAAWNSFITSLRD